MFVEEADARYFEPGAVFARVCFGSTKASRIALGPPDIALLVSCPSQVGTETAIEALIQNAARGAFRTKYS